MARQASTPVQFERSTRVDSTILMTSGEAGVVQLVAQIPLLRGDSASGSLGIDVDLAEMPRPTLNAVNANVQAWFVPKTAHPKFAGYDEFMNSYQGEQIRALGQPDRDAPNFFDVIPKADVENSEMYKSLGLHVPDDVNGDLIDAFVSVYNFRLAAHTSRLPLRAYAIEDIAEATSFPPAFFPSGRREHIVPDYERALVVGSLDLDVLEGRVNIANFARAPDVGPQDQDARIAWDSENIYLRNATSQDIVQIGVAPGETLFGTLGGQTITTTLADIDKARTTQAFAQLRTAYAGNDTTGFSNDDAIVAELMQGFRVPEAEFKRPWLLDSKRVTFGMVERHATDGGSLDESVSQGRASATLSLNVPVTDVGGYIIVTLEVLPERIDEAASDESLHITKVSQLPDALRDVQRPEPVDYVTARRIDARHTNPDSFYGHEPMNNVWNRDNTRLGGVFYQSDPANPFKEQRSALWLANVVDPELTRDHWLAPTPFPKYVFSYQDVPAFECVVRHSVSVAGLTQMGDVLAENNDDYDAIVIDDDA